MCFGLCPKVHVSSWADSENSLSVRILILVSSNSEAENLPPHCSYPAPRIWMQCMKNCPWQVPLTFHAWLTGHLRLSGIAARSQANTCRKGRAICLLIEMAIVRTITKIREGCLNTSRFPSCLREWGKSFQRTAEANCGARHSEGVPRDALSARQSRRVLGIWPACFSRLVATLVCGCSPD